MHIGSDAACVNPTVEESPTTSRAAPTRFSATKRKRLRQPWMSTNTTMNTSLDHDTVRQAVRSRYGSIAEASERPAESGCGCGPSCCSGDREVAAAYTTALGYAPQDPHAVPSGANLNLGCGNPLAIASIQPGETVLDLGSGAGFDCFLAANQLAGNGRVIGVDMTPAMITRARRNAARSGHANVEFRLGEIEALPVADATVDLIISNCVINLSPEKPQVFREAFRVLRSGGRLSIADVVARAPIPEEHRRDFEQLAGCVSGAETIAHVTRWLQEAGFADIRITPRDESRSFIETWQPGMPLADLVVSAMIEARKP